MAENRSNKKSRYVSYGGDDNKIKMLVEAVNRNTEDNSHDQITSEFYFHDEEDPRYYMKDKNPKDGDLITFWKNGIGLQGDGRYGQCDYFYKQRYDGRTPISLRVSNPMITSYDSTSFDIYTGTEYVDSDKRYVGYYIGKFYDKQVHHIEYDLSVEGSYISSDLSKNVGILFIQDESYIYPEDFTLGENEVLGTLYEGSIIDHRGNNHKYYYQSLQSRSSSSNDYYHYSCDLLFTEHTNEDDIDNEIYMYIILNATYGCIRQETSEAWHFTVASLRNFKCTNCINGYYNDATYEYLNKNWRKVLNPGTDTIFKSGLPDIREGRNGDIYLKKSSSVTKNYDVTTVWGLEHINISSTNRLTPPYNTFGANYDLTNNRVIISFYNLRTRNVTFYASTDEDPETLIPVSIEMNDECVIKVRLSGLLNDGVEHTYKVQFDISSYPSTISVDEVYSRLSTAFPNYDNFYTSSDSGEMVRKYDDGIHINNIVCGNSFNPSYELEVVTSDPYVDIDIDVSSVDMSDHIWTVDDNNGNYYTNKDDIRETYPAGQTPYPDKHVYIANAETGEGIVPYYYTTSNGYVKNVPSSMSSNVGTVLIVMSNIQVSYEDGFDKIYYKLDDSWIEYKPSGGGGGGSSDLEAVEIDKDTYEGLSTEEKEDPNKIYFVNDYPSGGGGGGGSSYGYVNPTAAGSDGDIYYLLDNFDKKRGTFLYMVNQWKLIDGLPHYTPSEYIPQSDPSKILCEATLDNFDATRLIWGEGNNPVQFSSTVSLYNSEAVSIPTKTDGTLAYVDIGNDGHPFTAYIVAKVQNANGSYTRILSSFPYSSASSGQGIMLYGTTVSVSSWANDSSLGVSATNNYFVGVIQFAESGSAAGKCNNSSLVSKPPTTCGRYITIGRTNTNPNINNPEPTDMLVKYMAVVDDIDDSSTIGTNVSNLMTKFGIS